MRNNNKKVLVVGLGNPGEKYMLTRHNVGFMLVDKFIEEKDWKRSGGASALLAKKNIGGIDVDFLKPETYMNNSGVSVVYASKKAGLKIDNIIVVCDDLDLPLGKIRISKNRGDGGHNGLKSIEDHLKSADFTRVRVGISRSDENGNAIKPAASLLHSKAKEVSDFVLKPFTPKEQPTLKLALKDAMAAVEYIIKNDVPAAMNKYN